MPPKKKYSDVKAAFEKRGWKLLSEGYENCYSRLDFECEFGHQYKVTWNKFKQDPSCAVCSGSTLTDENRLSILFPEIANEWDFEKNFPLKPEDVSYACHKEIWWVCKVCGYEWPASVGSRSSKSHPSGCPACSGRVVTDLNRLSVTNPGISEEWDFEKNFALRPEDVSKGSDKEVGWLCSLCGKKWTAPVNRRTAVRSCVGCRTCGLASGGRKKSATAVKWNNLLKSRPDIAIEWDYEKNFPLTPDEVSFGSNKVVGWVCKVCGYKWKTTANNRTRGGKGTGCSECGKVKQGVACSLTASERNNLLEKRPDLAAEWDYKKNFPLFPEDVSRTSHKKIWWKCYKCGKSWRATAHSRNRLEPGCKECTKIVQGKKKTLDSVKNNNFLEKYPEVAAEWDYVKNFPLRPEDVSCGGHCKAWWKCKECGRSWKSMVHSRVQGKGCSCSYGGPISKISQDWLYTLSVSPENREVLLPELGFRVDGYDPETNTVYEFLGDYWHGNPNVYASDEINANNKKAFGELFDETVDRLFLLRRSGYNLEVIWEEDF